MLRVFQVVVFAVVPTIVGNNYVHDPPNKRDAEIGIVYLWHCNA